MDFLATQRNKKCAPQCRQSLWLNQLFSSKCFLMLHQLRTEEGQWDHFIQPFLVTSLTDKTSEYTKRFHLYVKSWLFQKILQSAWLESSIPWGMATLMPSAMVCVVSLCQNHIHRSGVGPGVYVSRFTQPLHHSQHCDGNEHMFKRICTSYFSFEKWV